MPAIKAITGCADIPKCVSGLLSRLRMSRDFSNPWTAIRGLCVLPQSRHRCFLIGLSCSRCHFFETIVLPIGASAIPASFRCCIPNGIPIIVMKLSKAEDTWPIANQTPAKMNHIMFPTVPRDPVPISSFCVSSFRLMASLPKGKNVNWPITKHALPQGMPTTDTYASRPAIHHASPIHTPPRINQSRLPIARIVFPFPDILRPTHQPPDGTRSAACAGEATWKCLAAAALLHP